METDIVNKTDISRGNYMISVNETLTTNRAYFIMVS